MLRRRLSAGALRAKAAVQAQTSSAAQIHSQTASAAAAARNGVTPGAAAAKATISPREQSKSLASAVLLNTSRPWNRETVVTLKAELKKRGLSQQGNKSTLVSRLESADTTGFAPPVPPVSRVLRAEAKARAQRTRTYASSRAETSKPDDDEAAGTVATPPDVGVNAPKSEARPAPAPTPDDLTTAPGLPVSKSKRSRSSDAFIIHFPEPQEEKPVEQVIPTLPHKITKGSSPEPPKKDMTDDGPQVMTVASAGTHHEGGPVHGVAATKDAVAEEEALREAKQAADEVWSLSGMTGTSPLADLAAKMPLPSLPPAEGDGTYKASSRPLSDEERKGVWIITAALAITILITGQVEKDKYERKHPDEAKQNKDDKKDAGKQ